MERLDPRRNAPARVDPAVREIAAGTRHHLQPSWRDWVREDFSRYWFVLASLAWDVFGVVQIRDSMDPYREGMGWSPWYVYGIMLLFFVLSVLAEIYLYLRWWPGEGIERREEGRLAEAFASVKRRLRAWFRLA